MSARINIFKNEILIKLSHVTLSKESRVSGPHQIFFTYLFMIKQGGGGGGSLPQCCTYISRACVAKSGI